MSQSIVYKIWSLKGDLVYYGSTSAKYHSNRYNLHRSQFRCGRLLCRSNMLFEAYGLEYCLFQVVEVCQSKEHSLERERWYIENHPCVNRQSPLPSEVEERKKMAYERSNERRREKRAIYRMEHPLPPKKTEEEINQWRKEYQSKRKNEKRVYDIQYRKEHCDKVICECGGSYVLKHRSTHFKTKQHDAYVKKQ